MWPLGGGAVAAGFPLTRPWLCGCSLAGCGSCLWLRAEDLRAAGLYYTSTELGEAWGERETRGRLGLECRRCGWPGSWSTVA